MSLNREKKKDSGNLNRKIKRSLMYYKENKCLRWKKKPEDRRSLKIIFKKLI